MTPPAPLIQGRRRLFALSFLMLFVELALIRWLGSNILYLSYYSNFVLLGSFLGIGIGFLRGRSPTSSFRRSLAALATLIGIVLIFPVRVNHQEGGNFIFFGGLAVSGPPIWITLPIIFLAVAIVMATIAEETARSFVTFSPLHAYRLDVMGSIAGIAVFSLLSFMDAPPLGWGLVVAILFVLLHLPRITPLLATADLVIVALLAAESLQTGSLWSPYYKITTATIGHGNQTITQVSVNGVPHQTIESVDMRRHTEEARFIPYEQLPRIPKDVLIVGAGTGGDVAIALSEGVQHVDAVEIDPRLYQLGKDLNPDHPYDDPRVHVYINDGRAFLQQATQNYDLIIFALPDSITLVPGQSALRLESYLFTQEAMTTARHHLSATGEFAQYNYYRESWLLDRYANTLLIVHGRTPCSGTSSGGLSLLTDTLNPPAVACPSLWKPHVTDVPSPAADDHPFPYLRTPGVPGVYLLTAALILLASSAMVGISIGRGIKQTYQFADLFFMGAAFLLLETKNVVQFALLFGTTWFVNALVFAGVLLSVLAAIEAARHIKKPHTGLTYGALLIALIVAWLVPASTLLTLAPIPRFLVAAMLAFMPIFLANLVFAERFRDVSASNIAFGANLLGAMVGGLVEYSALAVGYRALLIVTAILYGCAFLCTRYRVSWNFLSS